MPPEPTTIVIADSHLLTREGIKSLLSKSNDYTVSAEVSDTTELAETVAKLKPNVVIIDFHLPGAFSLDDIAAVYRESPETRVMVVTTSQNKNDILKALEYGVNNYILKLCDEQEFVGALAATVRKEKFFCSKVIDAILEKHFPKNEHCEPIGLSTREIEIVGLISKGFTNKTIAAQLHLSVHTVSTHRKNVLKKLSLNNSSELVSYAIQKGIISTDN